MQFKTALIKRAWGGGGEDLLYFLMYVMCVCYVANIEKLPVNSKRHSSPGIYPDHICGALLWWLWDERPADKLWEELQPAPLHVHHALHQEREAEGWTQRAVQEEDHPHHYACLPLRQDPHQCHPERGGKLPSHGAEHPGAFKTLFFFGTILPLFLFLVRPDSYWSRHRGHAEED